VGKRKDYVPLAEREFCINGHRIAEVGLAYYSKYPKCKGCWIKSVRKAQLRNTHPRAKLPFDVIDPLIGDHHVHQMSENLQRAYYRSRRQGYTSITIGDELATFIGRHPFELWGWDFYVGIGEDL